MGFLDFLKRKPAAPAQQEAPTVTLAPPSTQPSDFSWPAELGGSAPLPPPSGGFEAAFPPIAGASPSPVSTQPVPAAPLSPIAPVAPHGHLAVDTAQDRSHHVQPHTLPDFTKEDLSVFDPKMPTATASVFDTPLAPPQSAPSPVAPVEPIPVVIVPPIVAQPAQVSTPPVLAAAPAPKVPAPETSESSDTQALPFAIPSPVAARPAKSVEQQPASRKSHADDVLTGILVGAGVEPDAAPVMPALSTPPVVPPVPPPVVQPSVVLPPIASVPTAPQPLPQPEKPRFISSAGYLDVIAHTRAVRRTLRQGDETIKEALARSEQLDQFYQRLAADMNTVQESLMRIDATLFEEVP